jgi:hypothetical protein
MEVNHKSFFIFISIEGILTEIFSKSLVLPLLPLDELIKELMLVFAAKVFPELRSRSARAPLFCYYCGLASKVDFD